MPRVLWKGLPATFPNATCVQFAQSGHYPMYEKRDRFDRELFAWMERNQIE